MADSPEMTPEATFLARDRGLYRWVFGPALLVGGAAGLVLFLVAMVGTFGSGTSGPRNPALLVILVGPLAVSWGFALLLHRLLRRWYEPRWQAELGGPQGRDFHVC